MAIKVLNRGTVFNDDDEREFLCDTETDINDLPTQTTTGTFDFYCGAGSLAFIAEGHTMKVLNNQGVWV